MSARVIIGDCREAMGAMDPDSFDAIVTDPPYELGFMGKRWDRAGVAFDPATWAACYRVLKPGGRLLAFGAPRTAHRIWCAIEDGGFQIEDTIAWLFGSGFPKHRSKLKPAHEPVCVARKGGASELNIDDCRIATGDQLTGGGYVDHMHGGNYGNGRDGEASGDRRYGGNGSTNLNAKPGARGGDPSGRWPANVILDDEAARALDEQSGELTSGANPSRRGSPKTRNAYGTFEGQRECTPARGQDTGGASRFFYVAKASRAERNFGLESGSIPAVSVNARPRDTEHADWPARNGNHHPTVKPVDLMRHLVRLVTPAGRLVLDPFAGSGTTGIACVHEGRDFVGIELSPEYAEIAERRIAATQPTLFG